MNEALLMIMISIGSKYGAMSAVRYDSVEQCEMARTAVLKKYHDPDSWNQWISPDSVTCIEVAK